MNAIEMLEDYKNKGERVDEVLFNHISKELHHLRTVINQKNFSIDLIGEQKFEAQIENKRLREALDKITDLEVFDGKSREHYQSLAVQAFCIACKALEGDSNV